MALSEIARREIRDAVTNGSVGDEIADAIDDINSDARSKLDTFNQLTASVTEINRAADEDASVETLAETRVLLPTDSRKTLFLASATEFDTVLPAPDPGLRYTFKVGLAPSGANYTITTDGVAQNIIHGLLTAGEDGFGASPGTNGTPVARIAFVSGKAQIGDWVYLICDGTYWHLEGACYQQDAVTLTAL